MSSFVVVVHFNFAVVVEAVRKVGIRVVCGFPSAVGKSVLWTFPRSGFSTAFRRRLRVLFFGCRHLLPLTYRVGEAEGAAIVIVGVMGIAALLQGRILR